MKHSIVALSILFAFLPVISLAQTPSQYKYSNWKVFYHDGTSCEWGDFLDDAQNDCPDACSHYFIGRGQRIAGIVNLGIGAADVLSGVLMIVEGAEIKVDTEINDYGNQNPFTVAPLYMGLIGAGFGIAHGIVGTVLLVSGSNHYKESVSEYNSSLGGHSAPIDYSLRLGPTRNGMGLTLSFSPSRR